ncbi:MAG TPA: hypothetical protein PK926_06400 [Spirochaetota bacterium]|nr:hypothetical protein [Spirochaetota bacterium]HPI89624.1 hypothetical protein [Spirochaetota bacterium]HPR49203.1 hypothetical protein [Spirochaetota bacterium]
MLKKFRIYLAFIISIFIFVPSFAQDKQFNQLYKPLPLIKRLSYENFKNIKLLQSAIMNYGGGESEVEQLIDQYAEASALYFQNRIDDAANKFSENERGILKVAQNLAKKYKDDSESLLIQAIKLNIKTSLRRSLNGEKRNEVADKLLANAQFGVQKGNDFYDRYKAAHTAPPSELVSSIYYYRRAKENLFLMYEVTDLDPQEKKSFFDQHKKDIEDNNNRIYKSREKEN